MKCDECLHFVSEEITKGLYNNFCECDCFPPVWNEEEECEECEMYEWRGEYD